MTDSALRRLANTVLWPGHLGRGTPDWVRRERDAGLSGVVLFSHNLGGPTVEPDDGFLVGIDEEGGTVTRLDAARGSRQLGAGQLGALDDVELTRTVAERAARRAQQVGANVMLGPVADVNTDPANPVIGTRAFGAETSLVARHVAGAITGIHAAGSAAVAKHYPGHGQTTADSHHALAVSEASFADQLEVHLEPFRAAVAAGARMIMTAHIVVPGWGELPATANPSALDALRGTGFDGVIVSDALDMAAMWARFGDRSAVFALAAGCDLLCLSNPANPGSSGDDEGDFLAVRAAIVDAVRDGALPARRLEEAASRVRVLRESLGAGGVGGVDGGPRGAATEGAATGGAPILPADVIGPGGVPGTAAGQSAERRLATRAVRTEGSWAPMHGPRTVVEARATASWAVGAAGSQLAGVVAAGGEVLPWGPGSRVAGAEGSARTVPAGAVILVDRLASSEQRDAVAAGREAGGAVVVNLGVDPDPDSSPLGLPALHCRAASRLAAEVAEGLLTRGWGRC